MKLQLEEGALHLVEEGLIQFFQQVLWKEHLQAIQWTLSRWRGSPLVDSGTSSWIPCCSTCEDHDWSVSPTSLAWLQEYKDFPNSVPFVKNVLNYSQPMCFTSFFQLDQHQVLTSWLLIYNMNNKAIWYTTEHTEIPAFTGAIHHPICMCSQGYHYEFALLLWAQSRKEEKELFWQKNMSTESSSTY